MGERVFDLGKTRFDDSRVRLILATAMRTSLWRGTIWR